MSKHVLFLLHNKYRVFCMNTSKIHIQCAKVRKEEMRRNVQKFDRAFLRVSYQTAMSLTFRLQTRHLNQQRLCPPCVSKSVKHFTPSSYDRTIEMHECFEIKGSARESR